MKFEGLKQVILGPGMLDNGRAHRLTSYAMSGLEVEFTLMSMSKVLPTASVPGVAVSAVWL